MTLELIKVMRQNHVFDKIIYQKYEQVQSATFWSYTKKKLRIYHANQVTNYQPGDMEGKFNNSQIIVPEKMVILLAFSSFSNVQRI